MRSMSSPTPPGLPPQPPPSWPPQGPPQMPPQGMAPQGMPPQGPPAKKPNVLMWILIAIGGIVVLGMVAVGVTSYLFVRTVSHVVKEAGFDPDLMQRNPGLAMAK